MLLTDLLSAGQIKIPVISSDRDEAILELLTLIGGKTDDPLRAYKAVLEREKIMTTGVGNAIAIPHCKDASCPEFIAAMGISSHGLDFKAIDNLNVHIIFLLLGPADEPNKHIKLLSRISRLMSNAPFREKLLKCSKADEAYFLLIDEEKNRQ